MSTAYAIAPPAPGGPGDPADDQETRRFLQELGRWRMRRDHELRAIDEVARTHADRDGLNPDITLAITLWHAVSQRHDLLLTLWDGGTLPDEDRESLHRLIWGLLEQPDGDAQALALPLPDAARLCDTLASSLRIRTGLDESDRDPAPLAESLIASVERIRERLDDRDDLDQGALDRLDELAGVLGELRDRASRGDADHGAIGDIEGELASWERDLILTQSAQAHDRADREQAERERAELIAKGEGVRALAQRALDTLDPAPRLGIPDVEALGEVPEEEEPLASYMTNLERVGRALDQAHSTYAAALAEYADLRDRMERLSQTLSGCGAPTSVDLAGMLTATRESLTNRPADLQRAAALIAAQEAYLGELRTDQS